MVHSFGPNRGCLNPSMYVLPCDTHVHPHKDFAPPSTEKNKKRTDETFRRTVLTLGGKDREIDFVAAVKAHDPTATAAAKAERKVTGKATANKTLVTLALKVLKERDSRGLSAEVLVKRGLTVRLTGDDRFIGMNNADILERAHKVREWVGEGGAKLDDWNNVVKTLMTDKIHSVLYYKYQQKKGRCPKP
jgi:hypothetical protein